MDEQKGLEQLTAAFEDASINLDGPLKPELLLEDIEELDSVSRARLILSIEDVFQIEMPLALGDKIQNVGDLLGLIRSRMDAK